MSHPPSQIIQASLIAGGVGTEPTANAAWPVFVSHLPSTIGNALCVYDTAGKRDGRLMAGATIKHPGIQIRCRAVDYPTGYAKMKEVEAHLDAVLRENVALDARTYTIAAVTQTGDILTLGREPDEKARESFTLNGTTTIKDTTP